MFKRLWSRLATEAKKETSWKAMGSYNLALSFPISSGTYLLCNAEKWRENKTYVAASIYGVTGTMGALFLPFPISIMLGCVVTPALFPGASGHRELLEKADKETREFLMKEIDQEQDPQVKSDLIKALHDKQVCNGYKSHEGYKSSCGGYKSLRDN